MALLSDAAYGRRFHFGGSVAREVSLQKTDARIAYARAVWRRGGNISLVLAAELMGDGYDVEALENKYAR